MAVLRFRKPNPNNSSNKKGSLQILFFNAEQNYLSKKHIIKMSDVEEVQVDTQAQNEVEVPAQAAAPGELSIEDAVKGALRIALASQGLARGLREAVKALASEEAQLCILVESVDEAAYLKLVESLCNAPSVPIPLIKVTDAKALGEWAGLGKIDRDGNARKVVGCSCVVIKNWGSDSEERQALLKHFEA